MPDLLDRPADRAVFAAHNQPPPLYPCNAWRMDRILQDIARAFGIACDDPVLCEYGAIAGSELAELGFAANAHPPAARFLDARGLRINAVDYHPAYHRIMARARAFGLHSLSWEAPQAPARIRRSLLFCLHYPFEAGTLCPVTMTHAAIPALRQTPALARLWEPGILARDWDPSDRPAPEKRGLSIGMGMTEKQGGSDVRGNTTRAVPLDGGGPGGAYALSGHKWFFSAPMSDAFLVLAQAPGGLSCFVLPRWREDGERNDFTLLRLKDKLGDRANASSEVEFNGAFARLLGEEGRGVPTIIQMVAETRLDCLLGSAGLMRQATLLAVHHARHRRAFGRALIDQPLMRNVLADLALEAEAALWLGLRVAQSFADAPRLEIAQAFKRLATPIGKYWVCKRSVALAGEALECLGGNGYVEDFLSARLYRQAPLNGIWEGSGNIQCLDVLRALTKTPAAVDALWAECADAAGAEPRVARLLARLRRALGQPAAQAAGNARRMAEDMALALQASLMLRFAPPPIAEAFIAARLETEASHGAFGTLPPGLPLDAIIERAAPHGANTQS